MTRVLEWLKAKWGDRAGDVQGSYRRVFTGQDGQAILRDLAEFCYFTQSTAQADDPASLAVEMQLHEGMRMAFLHICEMASVTPVEMVEIMRPNNV